MIMHRGRATAAVIATTAAMSLAACGSGDSGTDDGGSADDVQAALEEGGSITVWAWEPPWTR